MRDSETDFCYSCGHKLGNHRISGRCDEYVPYTPAEIKNCKSAGHTHDFDKHPCPCDQFEFKPEEEDLDSMQKQLDREAESLK